MQPLICIIPYLSAAHGLTGFDTVATYFGIGKAAAIRVLTSGVHALTYVGDKSRIMSELTSYATPVILACCGQTKCTSLTGVRQKMWANKVGQSEAGAPKLAYLLLLLLPWLVPSSGVAGIADDGIPPCCPVCCIVLFQTHLCHVSLACVFPS